MEALSAGLTDVFMSRALRCLAMRLLSLLNAHNAHLACRFYARSPAFAWIHALKLSHVPIEWSCVCFSPSWNMVILQSLSFSAPGIGEERSFLHHDVAAALAWAGAEEGRARGTRTSKQMPTQTLLQELLALNVA